MNNKIKVYTYYFDENGNIVSQDKAVRYSTIVEDENGNRISEEFGYMNSKPKYEKSLISQEEADKLMEKFKKDYEEIQSRKK